MKDPRIKIYVAPINVIAIFLKIFLTSSSLKSYKKFIATCFLTGPQRKKVNPIFVRYDNSAGQNFCVMGMSMD